MRTVELRSITRAAESLGVTQSAVSHMISSLEGELGFALLKRSRSGAYPTADGERVIPAIRGILSSHEQLSQTASASCPPYAAYSPRTSSSLRRPAPYEASTAAQCA